MEQAEISYSIKIILYNQKYGFILGLKYIKYINP